MLAEVAAPGYSTVPNSPLPESIAHPSPTTEHSMFTLLPILVLSPTTDNLITVPAPIVTLSPIVLPSIYAVGCISHFLPILLVLRSIFHLFRERALSTRHSFLNMEAFLRLAIFASKVLMLTAHRLAQWSI